MKTVGFLALITAISGCASADVVMFESFENGLGSWTSKAWIADSSGNDSGGVPAANLYGYSIVAKGGSISDAAFADGNSALKIYADQGTTRLTLTSGFSSSTIIAGQTYRFGLNYNQSTNAGSPEGRLFVDILWYDSNDQLLQTSRFSDGETTITPGRTFTSGSASTTGDFGNFISAEGLVHSDIVAPSNAVKFKVSIRAGGWVRSYDPYFIDAITVSGAFAAVPEPAAIGLAGVGAATLLFKRKR